MLLSLPDDFIHLSPSAAARAPAVFVQKDWGALMYAVSSSFTNGGWKPLVVVNSVRPVCYLGGLGLDVVHRIDGSLSGWRQPLAVRGQRTDAGTVAAS